MYLFVSNAGLNTKNLWVMNRDDLQAEYLDDLLFADGFDDAILGVTVDGIVAYDVTKMVQICMGMGMTRDEAWDYLSFNVFGAYVGEKTPIYVEVV
jgi:hypothetical protein